ncbi:MAG: GTPase HflX [Thermoleophilia bacterium]
MLTDPSLRERPRAVVFAAIPGGQGAAEASDEALTEIKELLASADVDWLADVVQHKDRPNPNSYLGPGKLIELQQVVQASGATVAVCEDDLTPAQVAAVLDAVDVDVLDRTELILSVFSKHAHSMEGTMQVQLAQLEYELTRVHGKGKVLSRLGAGVDMRGPGETKLEVDRRVIRRRIQTLRARIERMARTRRTQRERRLRADVPLIALAGYTTAGKSTLLNALTGAEVSVRDRLFETLDPTTRGFRHRDRDYIVTDTVGFIRKLPHQLVDAFGSTLEETRVADLILVVADAYLPAAEIASREQTVADVLEQIGSGEVPRLTVLNKVDQISEADRRRLHNLHPDAVLVSARNGDGLSDLLDRVADFFAHGLQPVRLLIPYAEAGIVYRLRGAGSDIREEQTDAGILVEASLPPTEAGRYRQYAVTADTLATSPDGASALDFPVKPPADESAADD